MSGRRRKPIAVRVYRSALPNCTASRKKTTYRAWLAAGGPKMEPGQYCDVRMSIVEAKKVRTP